MESDTKSVIPVVTPITKQHLLAIFGFVAHLAGDVVALTLFIALFLALFLLCFTLTLASSVLLRCGGFLA